MNSFINFYKDNILKIFYQIWLFALSSLGLIILFWFLNQKFFRLRLPKVIPFELTEIGFYFILYIIFIYLYIIFSYIKKNKNQNPLIKKIIDKLYLPLTTLDKSIKKINFIHSRIINFLETKKPTYSWFKNEKISNKDLLIINIIINIFPRIIIISFLLVDVFYYEKIEIFYKIIIIGILPLINRYLKFSLKAIEESIIKNMEKIFRGIFIDNDTYYGKKSKYNQFDNPAKTIFSVKLYTIKEFLEIKEKILTYNQKIEDKKLERILFYNITKENGYEEEYIKNLYKDDFIIYSYRPQVYPKIKEDFIKENYNEIEIREIEEMNKKSYYDFSPKEEGFYEFIKNYFIYKFEEGLELILVYNELYARYKAIEERRFIRWTRIFIYLLYLISWSYILIKSYPTIIEFDMTKKVIEIMIERIKIPSEINN